MSDILGQATSKEHEELLKKEKAKKLWQTMQPHERLEQFAKEKAADPYAFGKMKISFPDIRAIKHFNGFILIIVDEKSAFDRAVKIASEGLGPEATVSEIIQEAHRKALKTTALPLKKFISNLRLITEMTTHSQFYTQIDSHKNSELHSLFDDSLAAIKEAKHYRHTHPEEFVVDNINRLDPRFLKGEVAVHPKDFAHIFGNNWKSRMGDKLLNLLDINIYEDKDCLTLH